MLFFFTCVNRSEPVRFAIQDAARLTQRPSLPTPAQASYPLRPELAESTYYLYKATLNPHYLRVGRDMVASLQLVRAPCGYAMVEDVRTHATRDTMESFFLAETLRCRRRPLPPP